MLICLFVCFLFGEGDLYLHILFSSFLFSFFFFLLLSAFFSCAFRNDILIPYNTCNVLIHDYDNDNCPKWPYVVYLAVITASGEVIAI